jgi:hypothetical protein
VTASSTLGQLGLGALPIVAAVLASRQHQPAATGWLMTAIAVGALIGSLLWTWRPVQPAHTPLTVMIASLPSPTQLIFVASAPLLAGGLGALALSPAVRTRTLELHM